MKSALSFTHRATLGGLAVALLASGCASLAPSAQRWTMPPLGSTWEVAQRNTGSYGKDAVVQFTRGESLWQGSPTATIANSQGMTIMAAPNGHWMALVGRDGRPAISWDPPLGFAYPMTVGKTWVTPYRMTLGASGKTVAYDLTCKVDGHEKVTVKAGSFDAFKVVCSTNIGNEETYWVNPDMGVFVKTSLRRTAQNPFGAGTQEAELASVPAAKR